MNSVSPKPQLSLTYIKDNSARRKLTFFSFIALAVIIAGQVFVCFSILGFVDHFRNGTVTMEEAQRLDLMMTSTALIFFAFYILCVVSFIMWMHRGYKNLEISGRFKNLDFASGWAIGAWFIPFMNLVRPYKIVSEYWSGIQKLAWVRTKEEMSKVKDMTLMIFWWVTFLIGNFCSNVSFRVMDDEKINTWEASAWMDIWGSGFYLVSIALLLIMLKKFETPEDEAFIRHNKEVELREPGFGEFSDVSSPQQPFS